MVTKELVELIRKRREAGISDEQIHAILENSGYAEDDLLSAIEASYRDDTFSLPTEADSHKIIAEKAASENPKKKSWWPF